MSECSGCGGSSVRITTSEITFANRWDHLLARWRVNRAGHRVEPGLHALGSPTADSPVFVTANYTLSFDSVRSALAGVDCYILALDTRGINVWCAAGKGTFGTDELVHRVDATSLNEVVNHRVLILPQLGATGVAAHEVAKRSGFRVEYGPVRASDLSEYLKTHRATSEMRRVQFTLRDRIVLVPVELVSVLLPMLAAAIVLYLVGGLLPAAAAIAAFLAGTVLFPILLPWLPTPNFTTKGLILGAVVALPFAAAWLTGHADATPFERYGWAAVFVFGMLPVTAYLALNFTGSTPITSMSGVKREMLLYIRPLAVMFGGGIVLAVALAVVRATGGAS